MSRKALERCPRCGASKCYQKHQPRVIDLSRREPADEFNPVDGFICPGCHLAFRVSKLETDGPYIVDWQVEFEFAPKFCPNCGKELAGDVE